MDLGDIIFLIILGLGFLSSIGGAKKKKQAPRPHRPPARPAAPSRVPAAAPRRSRLQEVRGRAMSQMEQILRELERQGEEQRPSTPPPPPPSARQESDAKSLRAASLEVAAEPPAVRDGTLHKRFHDKYIKPVEGPARRLTSTRVKRHLTSRRLREAVLLKEILGPPKALR